MEWKLIKEGKKVKENEKKEKLIDIKEKRNGKKGRCAARKQGD